MATADYPPALKAAYEHPAMHGPFQVTAGAFADGETELFAPTPGDLLIRVWNQVLTPWAGGNGVYLSTKGDGANNAFLALDFCDPDENGTSVDGVHWGEFEDQENFCQVWGLPVVDLAGLSPSKVVKLLDANPVVAVDFGGPADAGDMLVWVQTIASPLFSVNDSI